MTPHRGDFSCVFLPNHGMLWGTQMVMHAGSWVEDNVDSVVESASLVPFYNTPTCSKRQKASGKDSLGYFIFLVMVSKVQFEP